MDPSNPVIKLCVEGMKAEAEGRAQDALSLFLQAWEQRKNDYEACVAAHFVARHQSTPENGLHWNQESLHHARAVNDATVESFYPSLYLNIGKAHEDLGNLEAAKRFYELAASKVSSLPVGRYGDVVREGIRRGLERMR